MCVDCFMRCVATVQKIVSEIIPSDLVFSRDARDALIECCVEFIGLISTQANDIAENETKKTIASEHVIKALQELGFSDYIEPVREVIQEHKESQKVCCTHYLFSMHPVLTYCARSRVENARLANLKRPE